MNDPLAAVDEANRRFYRAFEALDLSEMEKVWARGEHVKCVHPGWPLLSGWAAVRASWEAIFDGTGEIRFTIGDVQIAVLGELAWVTCTENILSQAGDRVAVTAVLATNIFEHSAEGWLLVHHHASHVLGGGTSP
ncbi:MAG TPA: nuclear transport factor 2 family protein [Methylomirabilota bacterium]|nr:nuclear transport factor 2 family protein [Methylomirabilota bacterium]